MAPAKWMDPYIVNSNKKTSTRAPPTLLTLPRQKKTCKFFHVDEWSAVASAFDVFVVVLTTGGRQWHGWFVVGSGGILVVVVVVVNVKLYPGPFHEQLDNVQVSVFQGCIDGRRQNLVAGRGRRRVVPVGKQLRHLGDIAQTTRRQHDVFLVVVVWTRSVRIGQVGA